MKKWQAVVFDLDDTLYAERDYVLSGFRAVSGWAETRLGIEAAVVFAELKVLFEQRVRGDTFDRWLAIHGLNGSLGLAQEMVCVYREHAPVLRLFADADTLLSAISEQFRVGLLSDGWLNVQRRKLNALKLVERLDCVVFSDAWGREAWKPNTKPYVEALRLLNIAASDAVYIGDNPLKDFFGARELGMKAIQIQRPEGEYAEAKAPTERHVPDCVVQSLNEVNVERLERLLSLK